MTGMWRARNRGHGQTSKITPIAADGTMLDRRICRRIGRHGRAADEQEAHQIEAEKCTPFHRQLKSEVDRADEAELSVHLLTIQMLHDGNLHSYIG